MKNILICVMLSVVPACLFAQENDKDHNFEVAKQLDVFNAIYKQLDMMYVDTLDAEETIGYAIRAMLGSLDPYTEYYPEDKQSDLKMMMSGKYAGIGAMIRYHSALKRVVIDEPYANMPAAEAGVRKGDIVLSIDDSLMTDKTVSYVSEHLRGDAGTTFLLKVKRPSSGKILKFKITRRAIQMPAVTYYGMQPDGVGYLNLSQFTEGCAKEVRRAFLDMKKQGMTSFVLDLRNNGGGSLQEAITIVNMFVPKDITLVNTIGKMSRANRDYKTTVEPVDTVMPIVVLVNENSASASEITSGSLQDLDRAVVVGTRTYGKGLVQLPNLPLPYNGNLKVTTSKYYIPSGRCIQAINYKNNRDGRTASKYGERLPDSLANVFHTLGGREVRDGGGITPDVEVRPDSIPNIAYYLASSGRDSTEVMFDWEVNYIHRHPSVAPAKDFEISDADYEDFKQAVLKSGFTYDRESGEYLESLEKLIKFEGYYDDVKSDLESLKSKLSHNLSRDLDFNKSIIKELLANDIVSAYYYQSGAVENSLRHDKQWQEAVRLLKNPEKYAALLRPKTE